MPTLTINGRAHQVNAPDDTPLLWVIREQLKMTGTKFGCGIAQCGACTVHIDGQPARSCSTQLQAVAGKNVTTIEGLANGNTLHPLQAAWIAEQVPQCGYCQSGQIMTAAALVAKTANPSDSDIDEAMRGNLCRCGTYQAIRQAVHLAARYQAQAKGGAR